MARSRNVYNINAYSNLHNMETAADMEKEEPKFGTLNELLEITGHYIKSNTTAEGQYLGEMQYLEFYDQLYNDIQRSGGE